MAFCSQCGVQLATGSRFCHSCGAGVKEGQPSRPSAGPIPRVDWGTRDETGSFGARDIEQNRVFAALAYIPLLFFLPLVVCPDSKFGRFHANQGLVFFIAAVAWSVVFTILTSILSWIILIGWIVIALLSLVWVLFLVWFLLGVVNALGGRARGLPIIGKYRIFR